MPVREADVVPVVRGGGPQPDQLRARLLDEPLGLHGVAHRLGHLLAVGVDHETVGEHRAVGGLAPGGGGDEQARLEPAPVLVGALEVEVGGVAQRRPLLAHRGEGAAGVEPHVEDVGLLAQLGLAAAAGSGAVGCPRGGTLQRPGVPDRRPFLSPPPRPPARSAPDRPPTHRSPRRAAQAAARPRSAAG